MPNRPRIHEPEKLGLSSAHSRVSHTASWFVRRVAAVIVGIWLGGIVLLALAAPAAFRSVDAVLTAPPESAQKALKQLGPALVRDMLHYQVSEANRLLFESWGLLQAALGVLLFLLLLFFSSVRRTALVTSLLMLMLALLMQFVLIPRIVAVGRELRASMRVAPAEAIERFKMLHGGFAVFEAAAALLGAVLLVLLLRTRSSPAANHGGLRSGDAVVD